MSIRMLPLPWIAFAAIVLAAHLARADGLILGETKEQLRLDYKMSAKDHGTGRVTVILTITDQGRLKPMDSVDLRIPSDDGTNFVDLSVSLTTRKVDGKQVARVHLIKELAKRAELHLTTHHLDGKQEPSTWYLHAIPIAKHIKDSTHKKK